MSYFTNQLRNGCSIVGFERELFCDVLIIIFNVHDLYTKGGLVQYILNLLRIYNNLPGSFRNNVIWIAREKREFKIFILMQDPQQDRIQTTEFSQDQDTNNNCSQFFFQNFSENNCKIK